MTHVQVFDRFFYPALFLAWSLVIIGMHADYRFLRRPPPGTGSGRIEPHRAIRQRRVIRATIEELNKALRTERNEVRRMHIAHNLGVAYYDMHSVATGEHFLDSSQRYFKKSTEDNPSIARFYYNLGRTYTASGDHVEAKTCYEKAVRVDPEHILAIHNLGLVNYFELHRPVVARKYFEDLLRINAELPVCNYVLGEIALDNGESRKALRFFMREVEVFDHLLRKPLGLPMPKTTLRYAAATSCLRAAVLFAERFDEVDNARKAFASYVRLETDYARRKKAIERMKRLGIIDR